MTEITVRLALQGIFSRKSENDGTQQERSTLFLKPDLVLAEQTPFEQLQLLSEAGKDGVIIYPAPQRGAFMTQKDRVSPDTSKSGRFFHI